MINPSHSSLEHFWNERCEISEDAKVPKGEVYATYCDFARSIKAVPLSINEFSKALKSKPQVTEGRSKKARFWQNFRLIDGARTSIPDLETADKGITTERAFEIENATVAARVPNFRIADEATNELVRKNLFGIWERRRL